MSASQKASIKLAHGSGACNADQDALSTESLDGRILDKKSLSDFASVGDVVEIDASSIPCPRNRSGRAL
jgi:hypothetical protein